MNTIRYILFFLSLFISNSFFTQEVKSHKFVPFFTALRVDKLSHRLTNGCSTDEEKVASIHSWIIHNIRYDVGKWMSCDYSKTPIKRILFKRKAVCAGYTDLFNELCKYADIPSVYVSGYFKNEYTDLGDKCYIDEHAWNAVLVNNKWQLVDACWDAGFIEYYKRTFAGYFVFAFTLGTSDRLVYRPHFSQNPTNTYFLKSGNFFSTDHIPADSMWQLMNPIQTITSFESDSSYYLGEYDTVTYLSKSIEFDDERIKYLSMKEEEKEISDGFSSFQYNDKNNFGIANSYYTKANKLFGEVNPLMTDKVMLISKCDSVELWSKKSIIHCDTNASLLLQQKNELIQNNLKKKTTISTHNKALISSTDNVIKNLNSALKISLSGKILIKTYTQRNKLQANKIKKNNKFEKMQTGRRTNVADSTKSANQIILLLDSLGQADREIRQKYDYLNSLHSMYLNNLKEYAKKTALNKNTMKELCDMRLRFMDDLDYSIRSKKDELMSHKYKDDSLLIDGQNGPIVKHFYTQFNSLKSDYQKTHTLTTALITEYCKYKKANKAKVNVIDEYTKNIETYTKNISEYNDLLKDYKKKFKQIYRASKDQIEPAHDENHGYIKERFIEYQMNSIRSGFISRHYKSKLNENKNLKNKSERLFKKVEKVKKKIG